MLYFFINSTGNTGSRGDTGPMASPYPNTLTINHYLCEKLTGNTATYQADGDAFMGMIATQGNNADNSWRHIVCYF